MAYSVVTKLNNPTNRLRDALDRAEKMIVSVNKETVESFLLLLDEIDQMFEELSQQNIDLRPEQGRWQSLINRVFSKPLPIVRAAAKAGGFAALRKKNPPAENQWWRLDEIVYQRRRQSAARFLAITLIIGGILAAVLWGVNTLFPPDPTAVQLVEVNSTVDSLLRDTNYAAALDVVDANLETLPEEYELWLWKAVLHERLGEEAEAAVARDEAQRLLQDGPIQFWVALGDTRMRAGDVAGAEVAANRALEVDPEDPQVYFLLGGVAEAQGEPMKAVDYFNKTYELAEFTNTELAVIARVRMGQALQQGAFVNPTITETPDATPAP